MSNVQYECVLLAAAVLPYRVPDNREPIPSPAAAAQAPITCTPPLQPASLEPQSSPPTHLVALFRPPQLCYQGADCAWPHGAMCTAHTNLRVG